MGGSVVFYRHFGVGFQAALCFALREDAASFLMLLEGRLEAHAIDGEPVLPDELSGAEEMDLDIDKTAKTFSADLSPDAVYTLRMTGVNDYAIKSPETVTSAGDAVTQNIAVEAKALHQASGKFIDLAGNASPADVTAISFQILGEDGTYTYPATVADGGYTAQLRDGDYEAKVTANGYSVIHHVVVNGADTQKDMLLVSTAAKPAVDWVADIYVGYLRDGFSYRAVADDPNRLARKLKEGRTEMRKEL